jgi:tRNA A-37 threonylcarbamoyl transferase component Bud32
VIAERYRIDRVIGTGGMGAVYQAEHLLMKKVVALKLLHPALGQIDDAARRFEREAQSASRLSHAGIISVTDFGRTSDGQLFLAMEFVLGEPIAALLKREGKLPVDRAVDIIRQVLRALSHAHGEGVVHRDLKPDNIMLTRRDDPGGPDAIKLLDFGIAKMSDGGAGGEKLTQAGVVFGTPWYMSPEQAIGDETDARADLYSTGVVFYELVTGVRPFVAEQLVQVISMHLTVPPRPPRELVPELPEAIERAILRAMDKDRTARFQTAAEFLAALEGGVTGAAPRTSAVFEVSRGVQRPSRLTFTVDLDAMRATARSFWAQRSAGSKRAIVGGAVAMIAALVAAVTLGGPSKPAKPDAEIAAALKPAEDALARGDLAAARAVLLQQLSAHPDVARVHYLLGTLEFVDRHPDDGLDAYRKTIQLDAGYATDAAILRNVQATLDDRKLGSKALHLLADTIGKPASQTLALIASHDKRAELRHDALSACERLGCLPQVDRLSSYLLDLQQEKRCEDRRPVVVKLKELGDKRALDALRKAKQKSGSVYAVFGGGNECMKAELEAAIEALSK